MTVAHINWGRLRHPFDDPRVAEFADNVPKVNRIAERSPGFVWRMEDEEAQVAIHDPEGRLLGAERVIFTCSMWDDVAAFAHFVRNTLHGRFLSRRTEWFEPMEGPSHVIWPVDANHRPDLEEAIEKIEEFRANGPSASVYDLSHAKAQEWWDPAA